MDCDRNIRYSILWTVPSEEPMSLKLGAQGNNGILDSVDTGHK